MRRILSVTGVVCLLLAGTAWAQWVVKAPKAGHHVMSGILTYTLKEEPSQAVRRMLSGFDATSGDRLHNVVIHPDGAGAFEAFLESAPAPFQNCHLSISKTYYCSGLSKSQLALAAQSGAIWIRPQSRASRLRGSVTSAGDDALGAADLRARLGVDGRGVNVGIISDGLVDLQASVDLGDLPDNVQIINSRDGDSDDNSDEGRAMAEIIHDLAPGANLLFHSGFPSSVDMIAAIEGLTAAGADIIVDDLGFFAEPVFEDGPIAQAVKTAVNSGVVYVTAAGNGALNNYQAMYRELNPNDGSPMQNEHDFGGGDRTMAITVSPGGLVIVFLQWADRFDGLSSTADYDLYLLDASETVDPCTLLGLNGFCSSVDPQLVTAAPPLEIVALQNTRSEAVTINVLINRLDGDGLPLRLLFKGGLYG